MQYFKILTISLLSLLFFTSCEDVIQLDLENAEPQLIIEATINTTAQTARVLVSESNGFYDIAAPVPVQNATVELISEQGDRYFLDEIQAGIFEKKDLEVEPNQGYFLTVEVNGQRYEAEAVVPFPATLESLNAEEFSFPFQDNDETTYQVFINWNDPLDSDNYYRIRSYRDGDFLSNNYMVLSDELQEGELLRLPIREEVFEAGETVTVELLSTDKAYYEYFLELMGLSSSGPGGGSITPYNPQGNFSNGALGYFGMYSVSRMEIEL